MSAIYIGTHVGPRERYVPGSPEHQVLDQQVAADFVGRGRAPHAEQLLAGVHDADILVDDDSEREETEQQPYGYGREL